MASRAENPNASSWTVDQYIRIINIVIQFVGRYRTWKAYGRAGGKIDRMCGGRATDGGQRDSVRRQRCQRIEQPARVLSLSEWYQVTYKVNRSLA